MRPLNIPADLKYTINKIQQAPVNDLTNLVNLTVQSIDENSYKTINLQTFVTKLGSNVQEIEDLFGVLLILIRWCQQRRTQLDKEIKNELTEQGFTGEWTNYFVNLVLNKEDKVICNKCTLEIDRFFWRVDISLYNNALKRAMSPTVIWNITLSNGKQYIIEISIKKFHEIRFNISTLLKELAAVKHNSLMKK